MSFSDQHTYYVQTCQHLEGQNNQLQDRVRQLESALGKAKEQRTVAKKHYKVLKDNFLWEVGAIIELRNDKYHALEGVDMWDKVDDVKDQSVHKDIVEKSPTWFEKVYPVNLLTKTVYKAKAEAQEIWNKVYKDEAEKE